MRHLSWTFVIVMACGGHTAPPTSAGGGGGGSGSGGPAPRLDLHCTPQADFDEAACAAREGGCRYRPPLICRGVDVDDSTRVLERRAFDAGTEPCTCICDAEIRECAMVP